MIGSLKINIHLLFMYIDFGRALLVLIFVFWLVVKVLLKSDVLALARKL